MADPAAARLTLRLFGSFEARLGDTPLPRLRTRKAQSLLALLALRPGVEVERAWLAGVLWPDSSETAALGNLRSVLMDLRRALGAAADCLPCPTTRTLCLDLAGAEVDVLEFDAAIARGDASSLLEAVARYRGPLLEDCSEEWVFQERQAREQSYLAALEALAIQALRDGDHAAAEQWLRRAVAVDPLRESAQRALMRALADGGNFAAALLVYRELRQRLHREINAAPDAETAELYQQLRTEARQRAQAPPVAADRSRDCPPFRTPEVIRQNLPLQLTSFIGREREMQEVRQLLDDRRLVTLTGAGGCGKTRLAQQVASDLLHEFEEGVFFVALAPISDPDLVVSAIAQTLGVRETGGIPLLESVKAYLQEKQLLLLLDNFEHVLAAAPLVAELLATAPGLKVLATSRARLHLRGEKEFVVPPLGLPDPKRLPPLAALSQYEAVELFVERARDVNPEFVVTEESASVVAEICARLDGLPLAIELAAARVRLLSPQALLLRLERRLPLLTGGARDLPERQRTLRSAIAWSYELLDESQKQLFGRLAVFAGGCTLEAAEAVCNPEGEINVLDGMTALVDLHLLRREPGTQGEPRFMMLETVREYGLERLETSGELNMLRRWRAELFLELAEEGESKWSGPRRGEVLQKMESEHDNLRAALTWSLVEPGAAELGLRIAGAMWWFWHQRGYPAEGVGWLERALSLTEQSGRTRERARALYGSGRLHHRVSNPALGCARLLESEAIWRELGEQLPLAHTLIFLAHELWGRGDLERVDSLQDEADEILLQEGDRTGFALARYVRGLTLLGKDCLRARSLFEESLKLYREDGTRWEAAYPLSGLGTVAFLGGDVTAAREYREESLSIFRAAGDAWRMAQDLCLLARVGCLQGDRSQAGAHYEEALELYRHAGDRRNIARVLLELGELDQSGGEYERARVTYEDALAVSRETGDKTLIAKVFSSLVRLAQARGQPQTARALLGEAQAIAQGQGADISMDLGHLFLELGDYAAARSRYEEGLALRRTSDGEGMIAWALVEAGYAAWLQGEPTVTHSHAAEALRLFQELENRAGILAALESLAVAALAQGSGPREAGGECAARLMGAVEALREAFGLHGPDWWDRPRERIGEAVRAASLTREFAAAWAEGRAMTLEQAVEYALEAGELP